MIRRLVAIGLLVTAARAAADDEDPRVLFASGRYAAPAEVFEQRWQAKGDAVDGVNAVVAWRTAGRYARAAALLSRVRAGKSPLVGDAVLTATDLEQRLSTLTATAVIDGPLAHDAIVRVDADPVERIGDAIVLDVGEHDVIIEQENCEPFTAHAIAYPEAHLTIAYAPRCDQTGTLHVALGGDPGALVDLDGTHHVPQVTETDLKLEPGRHTLRVAALSRPIFDEHVEVKPHQTTTVRVRFPWRARRFGWILGVTTTARAGSVMNGVGLALTAGIWGSRFRATFDMGSVIGDTAGLQPQHLAPGHPWIADTVAIHITTKPLWHGRLGSYHLAFDIDPIAARFDEIRAISYFGIRANEAFEPRVRAWSFLPMALSADAPYVHLEITLWPVSYVSYYASMITPGVMDATGFGAYLTILGGWRL